MTEEFVVNMVFSGSSLQKSKRSFYAINAYQKLVHKIRIKQNWNKKS